MNGKLGAKSFAIFLVRTRFRNWYYLFSLELCCFCLLGVKMMILIISATYEVLIYYKS